MMLNKHLPTVITEVNTEVNTVQLSKQYINQDIKIQEHGLVKMRVSGCGSVRSNSA